jgi:hypothetical protein
MIIIEYTASVFTPAGWRSVTITAQAAQTSKAMATVTKVVAIDGEDPTHDMSRTGARRQAFNGKAIALREEGARKRLSACETVAA